MNHKELNVWKEGMKLVKDVYLLLSDFPQSEQFGLCSQMRRTAISIPSNIAEGVVKHSDKETLRYLDIALGSLAELDTQMIISLKLNYISDYETLELRISKVRALLIGLINYYKKQSTDIKELRALEP